MVEYIKKFVDQVLYAARANRASTVNVGPSTNYLRSEKFGLQSLVQELDRLDPRDFDPIVQTDFVRIVSNLRYLSSTESTAQLEIKINDIFAIKPILDHYLGRGSYGATRQFMFLSNNDLKVIIERDYADLRLRLFPSGAWKPAVVIAGSILEAILVDRLSHTTWLARAQASSKAPNQRLPETWTLEKLIDVAQDIGRLPADPAGTIHQVLRDYRNFIHPKKEVRAAHPCTEAEAMLAIGALDSVCNYLERNP